MATAAAPLAGIRVLVTRARGQAADLSQRLEQLGATVVALPAIQIVPVESGELDDAIRRLDAYDWLIFTSANGVNAFVERMTKLGIGRDAADGVRVCAIGRATEARLVEHGFVVEAVPGRYIAEAVVSELVGRGVAGKRVLLPQAELARDTVAAGLRDAGAIVDAIVVYRTVMPEGVEPDGIREQLAGVDVATFASPSAVRNTLALAGGEWPVSRVVCIGPVTADAARNAGLRVDAVADEYSIPGLVDAVVRMVRQQEGMSDDGQS